MASSSHRFNVPSSKTFVWWNKWSSTCAGNPIIHVMIINLDLEKRGECTFPKSWPLSLTLVSLFDIMWHPLMLLEIENGQFLIWNQAKKMLLSSQEKNTTTIVKVPQIIFVEEKRSMEIKNNEIFSSLPKIWWKEGKVDKQWINVLYLKKAA